VSSHFEAEGSEFCVVVIKAKMFHCAAPAAFLLYSQRANISRMLLDTGPTPVPDMLLPIAGIRGVRAIDYDPVDNYVYWIESRSNVKTIRRARENSTNVS
jgi:low density lipoprotein receptor-related protein 5/6